jgi:zinc protease
VPELDRAIDSTGSFAVLPRVPRLAAIIPLLLLLGWSGCAYLTAPSPPPAPVRWAHEGSDLKPDPAVVWGRLENGLRYAILPHATPRQRASVTLVVQAGSYHERPAELGYAHFVEHLAFRDLRGFPDEGALRRLQTLGAGPHANAYTGMFETRYFFPDLPTDDPAALPAGLQLLRAMADGVEFKPDSIERERGVIFSEQRSRDAMVGQARPDELEFVAPWEASPTWPELSVLFEGTRVASRHPIGEEKTLRAATARRLRAFYERWYRADRMILVVAGDLESGPVAEQIRAAFATMAAPSRPAEVFPLDPPKNPGRLQGFERPAEPAMQLSLGVVRAAAGADDTTARHRSLARRLALAMLARRLDRTVETASAPFFTTEVLLSHYAPGRELVLLRAGTRPADWTKALSALDLEVRRVNELGFSAAEFTLAARQESLRTAAAARQEGHTHSAPLATALAFSIARGVVYTGARDDHELTVAQLARLDEKQCHAAFREMLYSDEWAMALHGPFGEGTPKPTSVNFRESRTGTLVPYTPPAEPPPFPFTDFGPTGKIVRNTHAAALGTDLVQFANGVRLNLKRTRFEPGHARVEIRLEGGRGACPPDRPGLDWRSFAWFLGGLRGLSPEDLKNMLAGKIDAASYTVSATAFTLSAEVNVEDLPLLFQVGTAFFVRPAYRAEAGPRALELARQRTAPYTSTAGGVAHLALGQRMGGGHPAYRALDPAATDQRTLEELEAWFTPLLAAAPLEIGVIGDFDPSVVIEACARTFGALPARATTSAATEHPVASALPVPFAETLTLEGAKGVAVAALAWPAPEAASFPARFRAHLLSSILNDRMARKLRSEMGETYSPRTAFEIDDRISRTRAYLHCAIEAAPERVEHVAAIAREIVATLARTGATAEEFERARSPLVRQTESDLRTNGWWMDVVVVAQSDPAYGEGWARAWSEYQSATVDEINALARAVLTPDRLGQLLVRPK